jgi:FkbM family methyltransferase
MMLKELMKNLTRSLGYEIQAPPRAYAAEKTLAGLLSQEEINLVLDVGANYGQFADELWALGYTGRLISFEPMAVPHAHLRSKAATHPSWTIADRTAVGAETGTVEIHVSENSVSSSILPMLPAHSAAAPQSNYVATEPVPLHRLDDLFACTSADRLALKIDVQGFEGKVLEGAPHILEVCRAVVIEMSLVPLYDGQLLALEQWDLLAAMGFEAWSLEPGFRDPATGRMLQLDGLFVRKESSPRDTKEQTNPAFRIRARA